MNPAMNQRFNPYTNQPMNQPVNPQFGQQFPQGQPPAPHTQIACSKEWEEIQQTMGFSVILGTRATGDLHLISVPNPEGVHFHIQKFPVCMGVALHENSLYVACESDIRHYTDVLLNGGIDSKEFQRVYAPRRVHFTGDLDTHEMAVLGDGTLIFAASKYSCVGQLSEHHSFKPVWKPDFIDELKPEDRCHLNGLCVIDGELKYVSMFHQSNTQEGWRVPGFEGGSIIDVQTGDVVCDSLTQPHAPRWYRDELYVVNSGAGEFGKVDLKTGQFQSIAYVAGYGRALSFAGDYALFGVSKPRHPAYIPGLKLHDRLKAMNAIDRCAMVAVNIYTGHVIEAVQFHGEVRELFECQVIPDCRSLSMLSLEEKVHREMVIAEPEFSPIRPKGGSHE